MRHSKVRYAQLLALLVAGACATPEVGRQATPEPSASDHGLPHAYRTPPRLDDGWRPGTPEELGLDRAPLEQMTEAIRSGGYANVHALLIVKDGRLVYEEYFEGIDRRWLDDGTKQEVATAFDRDTLHEVRSVTKSVTSALLGLALARGAIDSLDQPLADFFPEYRSLATPEKNRITLRHLATMSAGFDWNEERVSRNSDANHETAMYLTDDPAGFVLRRPLANGPGTQWNYSGGQTTLLGFVIARATGQSLGDLAREHLFEPLGITRVEWGWAGARGDGRGKNAWRDIPELRWSGSEPWSVVASPCSSLWLRPRDMLKIGALYLDHGRWNGTQVLRPDWVDESTRSHIDRPGSPETHGEGSSSRRGYGYQWWVDQYQLPYGELEVRAAYGLGGQRIWIVPRLALTAVHLAGNYDDWKAAYQAERLLLERVVPWALGIPATYRHEVPRPTLAVEAGNWPFVSLPAEERARYVGMYDQAGDLLEVRDEGGVLVLTLPVVGVVHLIPERRGVFAAGILENGQPQKVFWPNARLVFVLDEQGRVQRYEWTEVGTGVVTLVGRPQHSASESH